MTILDALGEAPPALGATARATERAEGYVSAGRVARPEIGTRRIAAYVSDGRGKRVKARIELSGGEIATACSCRKGAKSPRACAHAAAVSLLLSGAATRTEADSEAPSLEERELARRVERGRSGLFDVRREGEAGSALGAYRVASPSERAYRVVIRNAVARENGCTCDDFRTNRLGTCKHIEAVLCWLSRGRRRSALAAAKTSGPTWSYLVADPASGEVFLRLRSRAGRRERRVAMRFCDETGRISGSLEAAWLDLSDEAERAGIEIPREVSERAQRALEAAARAARMRRVEAEVRRAGRRQPGFSGTLYPYQVDGVAFLASRGRAILADDMGLGKTAQTIAAMVRMFRKGEIARALIVCPASLKHQWADEIRRFAGGRRGLEATVVSGGRTQRAQCYDSPSDVLIVNYELARSDRALIDGLGADLLVLDEAQRIKNWRTKTADAIKRIETKHCFVLTGTPLENRLDDLYSLMQVVDPHVLGPLWCFNRDFVATDERGKTTGYKNLAELRERLAPHLLRRRKQQVLDQLPETITTRRSIELSSGQRDVHDESGEVVARVLSILKKRPLTPAEEKRLLQAFQRMRMACNAPELVGAPKVKGGAPKLAELSRLLEEICLDGGGKVVVFTEWERMQALAAEVAQKLGLGHVRLHGGVPSGNRGELVRRFLDDPSCRVFFSTDAGGTGLNLQAANAVINLDLPWNPAVLAQRIARVHRIGQKRAVSAVLLVGEDSVEERIERTLEGKRALFAAAVGDDPATDALDKSTLASRVATLLSESYAAVTGTEGRAGDPMEPRADGPAPHGDKGQAIPDTAFDPRLEPVQRTLGDALERLLELPDGTLVAIASGEVGETSPPGAAVLPSSAADALEALGQASPLAAARVVYTKAPDDAPFAARQRGQLEVAARKLEAARTLDAAGHAADAISILHAALALLCRAAAERDPGDAADSILACVYGELLPAGALESRDAHALSRAGELSRAYAAATASPPADLVGALVTDTTDLLARLHERLGAATSETTARAA